MTELSNITEEEFELFRQIKPLIGECLRLNHELNNPLAGVIGYTELMLSSETSLTDNQKELLGKILSSAEKMKYLIEDLCNNKIGMGRTIDLQEIEKTFGSS